MCLPTTREPAGRWRGTSTPQEMGGMLKRTGKTWGDWGEEKWRPDRTGAPEGWLRRGRGSHAWRDPQGLRWGGWSAPSVSPDQSAREVCLALRPGPTPSEAPSRPHWSCGCREEAGGEQERQAGEVLGDWRRAAEGVCPTHTSPAGLPGGVPHPLRPEAGGMPGPLLFCGA